MEAMFLPVSVLTICVSILNKQFSTYCKAYSPFQLRRNGPYSRQKFKKEKVSANNLQDHPQKKNKHHEI